jgi:hypothetical protein
MQHLTTHPEEGYDAVKCDLSVTKDSGPNVKRLSWAKREANCVSIAIKIIMD